MADILVYGGEPGACAAALLAARRSPPGTEVVLCFPESTPGGAATVGGLCAWERRLWTHAGRRADPQGGSFALWLDEHGPVFRPDGFARALSAELAEAGVRVLPGHDIEAVIPVPAAGARRGRSRGRRSRQGAPAAIAAVQLRRLQVGSGSGGAPTADRVPAFAEDAGDEVSARVFIDASPTGRLARLAGVPLSPGRSDWNADGRQMAASLLFAVEGVAWDEIVLARDAADKPVWGTTVEHSPDGAHRVFWGGRQVVAADPLLAEFARAHPGVRLGPPRAWEEADGVFWLQTLLLYGVDARRRAYDAGTERDAEPLPPDALDLDTAWRRAQALVAGPDVLGCLRRFPGLRRARVARADGSPPRTGAVLVVRESVHAMAPGPERFALTVEDVTGAGTGWHDGLDVRHRPRRIGLGFHWLESAGYTPDEVLHPTAAAANPVYLPLDLLLCPPVTNLLVAGHAVRAESRAWWAMRAQPNLCVLGDAAGVVAAFSAREGVPVLQFGNPEVAAVQAWLAEEGAILEKW